MSHPKQVFNEPTHRVKKGVVRAIKPFRDKILFKYYLRKNTPVLVYQMGKVGSKSVFKSLCRQYSGVVLHAHKFHPNHANWRVRRLYHWVVEEGMPLNVISLTREPISRNVSGFFQIFEKVAGVNYNSSNFTPEELKAIFLTKYFDKTPLQWFDQNIKLNFGIDVYADSFPQYGYATYSNKNIRLLVMRSEISDIEKIKAIKDFLKLAEFQIVNRNIGEKKAYASIYKDFRTHVKLPFDYIDELCNSKYFNHFYGEIYLDAVREKWGER